MAASEVPQWGTDDVRDVNGHFEPTLAPTTLGELVQWQTRGQSAAADVLLLICTSLLRSIDPTRMRLPPLGAGLSEDQTFGAIRYLRDDRSFVPVLIRGTTRPHGR